MEPSARSSGSGSRLGASPLRRQHRRRSQVQQLVQSLARGLPGAALALLLCLLFGLSEAAAQALEDPTRWTLAINALGGQPALDHQRSLRLKDGQGGAWQLANRSQELVPEGAAPLPPASAQFDIEGLEPAPKGFLPLRLEVPLASAVPGPVAEITLGAQVVEALRELALQQLAELPAKGT